MLWIGVGGGRLGARAVRMAESRLFHGLAGSEVPPLHLCVGVLGWWGWGGCGCGCTRCGPCRCGRRSPSPAVNPTFVGVTLEFEKICLITHLIFAQGLSIYPHSSISMSKEEFLNSCISI